MRLTRRKTRVQQSRRAIRRQRRKIERKGFRKLVGRAFTRRRKTVVIGAAAVGAGAVALKVRGGAKGSSEPPPAPPAPPAPPKAAPPVAEKPTSGNGKSAGEEAAAGNSSVDPAGDQPAPTDSPSS